MQLIIRACANKPLAIVPDALRGVTRFHSKVVERPLPPYRKVSLRDPDAQTNEI